MPGNELRNVYEIKKELLKPITVLKLHQLLLMFVGRKIGLLLSFLLNFGSNFLKIE